MAQFFLTLKTQRCVYLGNGASQSDFNKIFDLQGICSLLAGFRKSVFPPLLAAILNFYVKCKNVFILKTERARVISTKLTCEVYAESTSRFLPKFFSRHYWRPC